MSPRTLTSDSVNGGIHTNTRLLRRHSDFLRSERDTARTLCDSLRLARQCAEPEEALRCHQLLFPAGQLEEYFRTMADFVETFAEDLERASRNAGDMLEDNKRATQSIANGIHAPEDFAL